MTEETPVRLYRCILDGNYFREREKAELHLMMEHNFKEPDESLIREVVFGPEIAPQAPKMREGTPTG